MRDSDKKAFLGENNRGRDGRLLTFTSVNSRLFGLYSSSSPLTANIDIRATFLAWKSVPEITSAVSRSIHKDVKFFKVNQALQEWMAISLKQ